MVKAKRNNKRKGKQSCLLSERNGVSRVAVLMKAGQTGGLSDLENRAIEAKNEGRVKRF